MSKIIKQPNEPFTLYLMKILEYIDEELGIDQVQDRWKEKDYNIESALHAKNSYEEWSGEEIDFGSIDQAILGTNDSGGLFPERLEAFFAGYIAGVNQRN